MTDRMNGGELQTVREYLGLTHDALAGILGVNPRTLRSWESGRDRIPERVREEVEQIESDTAAAVGELVAALGDMREPAVAVYRTDEELHAARPDTVHLTARWWRHVVARAVTKVPGVVILDAVDGIEDAIAKATSVPGARVAVETRRCDQCARVHPLVVAYHEGQEICRCSVRGGQVVQGDR